MPRWSGEQSDHDLPSPKGIDFSSVAFPSDALSVGRFRKIFPHKFDQPDRIVDGYSNNRFFFNSGHAVPEHLERLTELICAERVMAAAGYWGAFADRIPDILDDEEMDAIDSARRGLEENYQYFKLADSPETARLLIQQVEEEGKKQAMKERSKSR